MHNPRLQLVYDCASRLFIHQGYAKTQISHIVRETGISTGAIYDLFAGKMALYQFVIRCAISPNWEQTPPELPVREIAPAELEEQVTRALDTVVRRFEASLLDNPEEACYRSMLSDAFDLLSRYRRACLLFEANPDVFSGMFLRYKEYRLHFYEIVKKYLRLFMEAGTLRGEINPSHCAKFVIETLYWWAMHIHYDGFNPEMAIPEQTAKQICLDALLHAYSM